MKTKNLITIILINQKVDVYKRQVVLTPIITEAVKEINNLNEEDVKELVNIFTNSFSVRK